jgi:O-antigen ligase
MHESAFKTYDAAILATFGLAIAFALTFSTPTLSLQIVCGFIVLLVAFFSVPASLYLLIFAMLLSPELAIGKMEGRGVGGRELSIRFDDILLIIIGFSWLVKMIIYKELALIRDTPMNRPIIYYMVACVVATGLGVLSGRVRWATGTFYILKYFEYFFIFFMVVNHVRTRRQVMQLVGALFVTALLISLYAIYQIPSGARATAPFEGESGEPNTLGGYLVFIAAIAIGLILYVESVTVRVVLVGMVGLMSLALMATLSRSSYLAAAVLALSVFAAKWRNPRVVVVTLIVVMLVPLLVPVNVKQRVSETFFGRQYGGEIKVGGVALDLSTTDRIRSWTYVLRDWTAHPVLGYGVTGYAWADAQFVKILGETGLVGLVTFLFIIVRLWLMARDSFLSERDPFCKGLAQGFLLGMVAMLAHSVGANTFILIRIMEPFWLCAGLVILLPRLTAEQRDSDPQRALV